MPDQQSNSVFQIYSSALVWRFLVFQAILTAIPCLTFTLLMLGYIGLPVEGFSFTHDPDFGTMLGGVLIIASLFSFSSLFCCLGFFVSHAGRKNTELENDSTIEISSLSLNKANYSMIASINFLGLIFGVLTVFIFLGGFISGSLFPDFNAGTSGMTDIKSIIASLAHFSVWAKLAVWSFLFGFSERLLPNLLNNFAKQIEKDAKPSDTDAVPDSKLEIAATPQDNKS